MGTGYVTAIGAQVGQSTPGTQMLYAMGNRTAPRKRRKVARRKATTARTRTKRAKRGKARLVKGSRAAKAYMAKIRRKRRK